MVRTSKIWIFGQSHCLPYSLEDNRLGWDSLLSKKLKCRFRNFAGAGADNLFIFSTILQNIGKIKPYDIVVVGWSHPSRKTFILDETQQKKLATNSTRYITPLHNFYRNKPHTKSDMKDTLKKWLSMKPKESGIEFYDQWYKNYFNLAEQKINFRGYLIAVESLLSKNIYLPFYFSADSVQGIVKRAEKMCVTEFVRDNNLAISNTNAHMNYKGHSLWANKIYKKVQNEIKRKF